MNISEISTNHILAITGSIMFFARYSPPDGWLPCDGATVSRSDYSELFDVIGTKFGSGDGSSTFHLPNLNGMFIRGYDSGRGLDNNRAMGSIVEYSLGNGALYVEQEMQQPMITQHRHWISGAPIDDRNFGGTGNSQEHGTGADAGPGTHINVSDLNSSSGRYIGYTGSTSFDKTVPVNDALLACIKY